MKVIYNVKTGYRKETQAMFYAASIVSENEKRFVFMESNGKKVIVHKKDLLSIEREESNNESV